MNKRLLQSGLALLGVGATAAAAFDAQLPAPPWFTWTTVVNNKDLMPTEDEGCLQTPTPRRCFFNSYNQPSVNVNGLVVIRARSRGGGGGGGGEEHQPTHGIYTRDMGVTGSPIVRILDRKAEVPQPNNAHYPPFDPSLTPFIETPSFPRIDMESDTIATRGNHQPVWVYGDTRAGTTGIYTNPFGPLITGASKLGAVPAFEFFAVPGVSPPTAFDVFPGAPAVTRGTTLVFKGNYTVGDAGRTGVFYRDLVDEDVNGGPGGGTTPVVLIANNTDTFIPGTSTVFGSTSPPSAAGGQVVFAGFDDEAAPTLGGIFLAPLGVSNPPLTPLVGIGEGVPGEPRDATFSDLGEGGAFDGHYVGFWGAWGRETRTVRLYCPTEGNKDRIAYCNRALYCAEDGRLEEDANSTCDETGCWQEKEVPVHQGIFVHDLARGRTQTVAKTGARFAEMLFWSYSGKTPCTGGGHSEEGAEDDGEPARWRSSAFVAVSGRDTAFKAVAGERVGVYFSMGPGQDVVTVLDTATDGQMLDPEAPQGSKVTEVGLEREGMRGNWLAVTAKMAVEGGSEEDGMAGVYITPLPRR